MALSPYDVFLVELGQETVKGDERMNKLGLPILMVLLLLLAGGLLWERGYLMDNVSVMLDEETIVETVGINQVSVKTRSVDVIWRQGSGEQVKLRLLGKVNEAHRELYQVEHQVVGKALQVELIERPRDWTLGSNGSPDLEITLPEALYELLQTETASGDVSVDNVKTNRAEMYTRAGDIDMSRAAADELHIETTDGDVFYNGSAGLVDVQTAAGDVEMRLAELSQPLRIETVTGDVQLKLRSLPAAFQLELQSVAGDTVSHLRDVVLPQSTEHRIQGGRSTGGPLVKIQSTKGDITLEGQ
jgi:lia operon protein LiaG